MTHDKAFSAFANQVEEIIQRDVEVYATQVVQEKKQDEKSNDDKQENLKEKKE